jgi:hypothetical protein
MGRENLKEGIECPCCGLMTAVVKRQTNGKLYVFCRDGCNHQSFARTEQQNVAMAKKYGVSAIDAVGHEIGGLGADGRRADVAKNNGGWML